MDIVEEADRLLARSRLLVDEAAAVPGRMRKRERKNTDAVSLQRRSANRKLAPQRRVMVNGRQRNEPSGPFVSSTYVSIEATCPATCPFKGAGCYAQAGMAVPALDRAALKRKLTGREVIAEEAKKVDATWRRGIPQEGAKGGIDLRLHISGDVPDAQSAVLLSGAAARWRSRGGGDVWTFTHRWREVPTWAWGPIACLASVETTDDAVEALDHGYGFALTVERHESRRAWKERGVTVIPCPAQTHGATCASCRLCLDEGLMSRGQGVAFAVHGMQADDARSQLVTIRSR